MNVEDEAGPKLTQDNWEQLVETQRATAVPRRRNPRSTAHTSGDVSKATSPSIDHTRPDPAPAGDETRPLDLDELVKKLESGMKRMDINAPPEKRFQGQVRYFLEMDYCTSR